MALSLYQTTIPAFTHGLGVLSALLDKAISHAADNNIDPATLVEARLAPDMFTLAGQIQRACDTSKLSGERLSGVASPKFEDTETTLEELKARVSGVLTYLNSLNEGQFDGSDTKTITLNFKGFSPSFTGASYVTTFALPNFYFHLTTAYDILRHKGVEIGKKDYLQLAA